VSFVRDIAPILVRDLAGCAPCHIPRADGDIGFHNGGLDVTNIAALNRGGFNSSRNVIVPGRPCDSVLYLKVSPGPPFAKRMPFDGPPYLTVIELALFHDWIAEGAKDE